jgi:isoleucyl-tRNA synthetase
LFGKFVLKEGNEEILKILQENNALLQLVEITHKYPYDWRTKV